MESGVEEVCVVEVVVGLNLEGDGWTYTMFHQIGIQLPLTLQSGLVGENRLSFGNTTRALQ